MSLDRRIAEHYARSDLEQTILDVLCAAGIDIDNLRTGDLSHGDEFHSGWRPATVAFADHLDFPRDAHIVDLGAGIGGPARYFAEARGCRVAGVDLTEEFVRAANGLTRRCGLADRVSFQQGSVVDLPFADRTFDGAIMLHVGMNISDKARLFLEARRVLKPGARFGVYDVMRVGSGELSWPMPWAAGPETSFLATPEDYRRLLIAAGFAIESETDRSQLALRLAQEMREKVEREGPPPFNLQVLLGPGAKTRMGNIMSALQRGETAPIEMIARAV